jgi:hypothetical protein
MKSTLFGPLDEVNSLAQPEMFFFNQNETVGND